MKILLLSAYDAVSHQRWREDLQRQFPQHQWLQLSLPARYFSWRIRGNSLSWAFSQQELLTQDYDLLITTSMVDLSALRGFIPSLASIPTILYFHENQFAYPSTNNQLVNVEPQMITLYSALCADKLVFNSVFNSTTFMNGVKELLRRLPDHVPPGIQTLLERRSCVLPIPLADSCFAFQTQKLTQLSLVWNHRWEYDKGPERLLAMLQIYFSAKSTANLKSPFVLHVVGQQFRNEPAAFDGIKQLLTAHQALGQWGYIADTNSYQRLLSESHIVLSTAIHDFQGLAVLEAVAAGCVPLVPERLAYPEWFGEDYYYSSCLENPEREAHAMAERLTQRVEQFNCGALPPAPIITHLSWSRMQSHYDQLLKCLVIDK